MTPFQCSGNLNVESEEVKLRVMKNDNKKNKSTNRLGTTLPIGIGVGFALGLLLDNVGLWIPIGAGLGLLLGMLPINNNKGDQD